MLVLCMSHNKVYWYTLRILNTCGFSTATIVMQMRLNVMCIHVLSVLLYVSVDSHIGQWLIVMLLSYYTVPYDMKITCNILITSCEELHLCRTGRSCCFTFCTHVTLMGDFLIHRRHKCVVIFVVSENQLLLSLSM